MSELEQKQFENGVIESLPKREGDIEESEEEVLNYITEVSMKSQKYDGRCGKIKNVQLVSDTEIPDEQEEFMRKLGQYTDNHIQSIDPEAEERIKESQKELRRFMGLEPKDTPDIVVTIELPDSYTFKTVFDAPRFDSDKVDNKFMELYEEVLNNNVKKNNQIVGSWVPIKESPDDKSSEYEIDFKKAKRSQDESSDESLTGLDKIQQRIVGLVIILGLFMLLLFII